MARHAAPRSRQFRRRLTALAGLLGVAATVALGVLVAPKTPAAQVLPDLAAPSDVSVGLPPGPEHHEPWRVQVQAERDAKAVEAARLAEEAASRAQAERQAREAAEAKAAQEAQDAREEAEEHARPSEDEQTPSSTPSAPRGDYQAYALQLLDGDASEMAALQKLWGRESGWNPNAQNPTSTAYGIAQFLNGTWAGTGIAKTSDPYRQIEAGLIYINSRYGSPTAAWAHSQSVGWY